MFARLHQDAFILRLPEAARVQLCKDNGASIWSPTPGRLIREYVVLAQAMPSDRDALRALVSASIEYAASLPRKKSTSR
jgi:hypothetical protein